VVGNPPIVQAAVQVSAPPEVQPQLPDLVWRKVYETEVQRAVDLEELISNGGVASMAGGELKNADSDSVVRRYEFYRYTGPYVAEDHSPNYHYAGGAPELLGDFIAANMVAAILVPEPSTLVLAAVGLGSSVWVLRRKPVN
jgi:hypothetical protein